MTDAAHYPLPRFARLGLTVVAATSLLVLSGFVAALALVASVVVYGTNVLVRPDGLIALTTALPLAAFGAALIHKRLWSGAARPL